MGYGETARPWPDIVRFYSRLVDGEPAFEPIARLATELANSPFAPAGLFALTSMWALVLGPSRCVLDNPHLVVSYDIESKLFTLEYRDGSPAPWHRSATAEEVESVVERFLTKRARWFQHQPKPRGG